MTYKKLLEIWKKERESEDLQELSKETMEEIKNYLESLENLEEIPKKLKEIEIQRVKWLLDRIKNIRKEKIIKKNMEKQIDDFFENLIIKKKEMVTKKILVRILQDVPSFVGVDMKIYGPYKAEDVVLLPEQNVEALIKRGVATIIERRSNEK
ncbi:MAG: hypothetical protein QXW62_04710 [Candidatus Methanomethylicaceae archaeon]|nr:hypothetical protein [Candidatus Verstraetearchaeota archaeon]